MAFWTEVSFKAMVVSTWESAGWVDQMEVHLFLYVSSMSADSLWCHIGKEGIRPCGFDKVLPGVFLSQPLPFYAPETQHPTCSLLRLWHEVS